MNPEFTTSIAADRINRFHAEADAHRTRRQARGHKAPRWLRRGR